jgi:O-acetyl-ADP-ribose deacetylase
MVQSSNRIKIIEGDIVKLEVDAIVNAANSTLLGGGGVDGAIHRAAGSGLLEECRTLNGCPVGEAKITKGHLLPAKWVIHTVGPIWRGGRAGEDNLLASCYRKSLELAREYSIKTIAFPAISTGAYHFPSERAAGIAVSEIGKFLQENDLPETIFLVCFNEETCRHLWGAIQKSFGN